MRPKVKLLVAIVLGVVTVTATVTMAAARPGQVLWDRRWNGSGNGDDVGLDLAVMASGTVFVGGTATGQTSGKDIVVIKYDHLGNRKWTRLYDNTSGPGLDDECGKIAVDHHGNVYAVGKSQTSSTDWDYVTVKWSSSGLRRWVRRYDGPAGGMDEGRVITLDRNHNVYVSGMSEGVGTGYDYATVKYTANGAKVWAERYDNPAHGGGAASGIVLDSSGAVYVTGDYDGWGTSGDYLTVKYSAGGVKQWARRYDGYTSGADIAYAIDRDSADRVYVAGFNYVGGVRDIMVVKYSPSGRKLWARSYDDPSNGDDSLGDIEVDGRHVYVAGHMWNGANNDFILLNYNTGGMKLWTRTYDTTAHGSDYATDVATDDYGNIYVTGTSKNSAGKDDWLTIKYDSSGTKQWARRYEGISGEDDGAWVIRQRDGYLYATGYATGLRTGFDIATLRYAR